MPRLMISIRRKLAALIRSEEHTSELQSRFDIVCRLLLEKKNEYQGQQGEARVHDLEQLEEDNAHGQIADHDDDCGRKPQSIELLMRQEVGCGLSHVVSDNDLIANIQVGKQGAPSDDHVK